MSQQIFKIGTRGSLLALTQCTLIKNLIEQKTGAKFELHVMKTQGDQITDKPLWQLEGKDFFTKELDEALLNEKVDLVVHSYKDLGSERPCGIELAAITERSFAQDILLIKNETIAKLETLDKIIIGTSSPRRITNIQKSLASFLPTQKEKKIQCETLRGNVNTRIQKLLDGKYHAIVLALAGIERLAQKEDSKAILEKLVQDLNFMVLPQKIFPSSASQGALAIEIKKDRSDNLREIIKQVHSDETSEVIQKERKAFVAYGGGCHLAVGINVLKHKNFFLHIHQGMQDDKEIHILKLEGSERSKLSLKLKAYTVFAENDPLIHKEKLETTISQAHHLFVTSKHCMPVVKKNAHTSLWAGGAQSMKELASSGFWPNGCSEGLGHEQILSFQKSEVLKMMLKHNSWKVLSHDEAHSPVGEVIPAYTRKIQPLSSSQIEKLKTFDIFYWNSFFQYQKYTALIPELKQKLHATGLGKTFDKFCEAGIQVYPFIDMKEFESFFKGNQNE